MKKALVIRALRMAINLRKPPPGLIHHSDRDSQYASHAYRDLLKQHGMVCIMSRKGNCWDNAPVERFFSSLKREWTGDRLYRTRLAAIADVREYVAVFTMHSVCTRRWVIRHRWITKRTLTMYPETLDHYIFLKFFGLA